MKAWLGTAACWATAASVLLGAADPAIRVVAVVTNGSVTVSFTAAPVVDSDARAVVESGLLMTLTFTVDLRRPAHLWWDRTVASAAVASSVKFDNLTGVYKVSRMLDGHVTWSDRTSDFAEARRWLTTFDRIELSADSGLEPNGDYYVDVRMRASPRRTFSLWPWNPDDGAGRADFTFIR